MGRGDACAASTASGLQGQTCSGCEGAIEIVPIVCLMEVGLLTPPVGLNLYVIHGIAKHRPFSEVAIGSAPFFVTMLVSLAIVHAIPELSLWLPSVLLD